MWSFGIAKLDQIGVRLLKGYANFGAPNFVNSNTIPKPHEGK